MDAEISGYRYTQCQLWDVLLYATSHRVSIKAACDRLEGPPYYNWVYTFLKSELLDSHDLSSLELLLAVATSKSPNVQVQPGKYSDPERDALGMTKDFRKAEYLLEKISVLHGVR